MNSRAIALAALVLTALVSGCGDNTAPAGEAAAAKRAWTRLAVVVDGKLPASAWTVEVPVAASWKARTFRDYPGVATITRPFAKGCELFVQVIVVGSADGAPEIDRPRQPRGVQHGQRSVVVDGPSEKRRFDVTYRLAETAGQVFGGGATGPGAFTLVDYVPQQQSREVPAIAVVARGGTDGAGCFSVDLESAPGLTLRALKPIARMTRLEFDG